ncbi:MAG: EAL domain-containing protein [Anaerolineae bacterium]|nr:EAL domain-containing protein [Anaerolineae bacterium]MBT7326013.1 EAL domain-containing protein [Anaerolineae bacterium]MBT7602385.1 EAL domain-containing protein [Anaerolineae bacterium]
MGSRFKVNLTIKFIGYLIFLAVIPLLLVGLISLRVSTEILEEESRVYTIELVKNQREYLDLQLEQVESLIANISGVEEITNALEEGESSNTYTNLATQARIGYILNGYLNLRGLLSIDIFTEGGNHYHVGETLNIDNVRIDVKDRIYQEALVSNQNVLWTGIEDNVSRNSAQEKVISAVKILRRTDQSTLEQTPVGMLLVNYSIDDIYEKFSQINMGEGSFLMVIDAKDRIIYHPSRSYIGSRVSKVFIDQLSSDQGTLITEIDGEEMFITYTYSDKSNWYVLNLIPVNTFSAKTSLIRTVTFSLLIISFCFVGFSAIFVSSNIVSPIRKITDQFRSFQEGTLDYGSRLESKWDDEIGELVVWYNAFVESLDARRESEKRLSKSEERYALAVRGANDGLWDWDLRKNEIYLSPRWKQILGYREDEIGEDLSEWFGRIHPDCLQEVLAKINAHRQGLTPHFESEHRLRHKDNTYHWVLARGLALFDETGTGYRMAGSHTEITSRKKAEEQLRHDAFYDLLTGLPNRALFLDRLRSAIKRSQRNASVKFGILFLDLDHFKLVNDSLGHNIGDLLLQEVGKRLSRSMRAIDTVARLGGDEFGILLENIDDVRDATQAAGRIQNLLFEPIALDGNETITSASIGILVSAPGYKTPDEYLRDADIAMYRAKSQGKARYEIFDQIMREQMLLRLELEAELRSAIEEQELILYYQPIINLENQKIVGFESLLRWFHPKKGAISPDVFIPIAEETGLILPLGDWVLQKATKQLSIWQSQIPDANIHISVNLSGKQLAHPDLLDQIENAIQQSSICPSHLKLEVTESDIINDMEAAATVLKDIKQLGVGTQMDDFGTGYSSLSYLHQFPFDIIKIDRSFVMGMAQDKSKVSLIKAVILMAKELKKKIVAEGIETLEAMVILTDLGCEYGQGFYVSPAINPEDATAFLKKSLEG